METKVIQNKTLGLSLNVEVPATVEAYDELAGEKGACLNDANNQTLYQNWNSQFRKKLCIRLAETKNVEWPEKTDANGDVVRGPDKANGEPGAALKIPEKKFFDILRPQFDTAELFKIAQEVADEIKFNPAPSRAAGPNKGQINQAEQIYAAVVGGSSSEGSVAESCKTETGRELAEFGTVDWADGETMVATLANMIKYDDDQQKQNNKFL